MANKGKQSQKSVVIDEIRFAQVIPGMLKSAEELFNFFDIIDDEGKVDELFLGNIVSTTMISALCCELLLKYKLQLEGKPIEKTHELCKLFRSLSNESQKEIEKEFQAEISTISDSIPCDGWETVESIFKIANDAFVKWRYIVTINANDRGISTFPYRLHTAALSIYNTIPKTNFQPSSDLNKRSSTPCEQ